MKGRIKSYKELVSLIEQGKDVFWYVPDLVGKTHRRQFRLNGKSLLVRGTSHDVPKEWLYDKKYHNSAYFKSGDRKGFYSNYWYALAASLRKPDK